MQSYQVVVGAAQVAAYIGDSMLLSEAAIRFHNCAAPLLAAKAEHGFLRKALAACHVTLAEVKAQYASTVQVRAGQTGPVAPAPSACFWPSLHDFDTWHEALFWSAANAGPVFPLGLCFLVSRSVLHSSANWLLHMLAVQGSTECRQVAGQVAAAVAYHLLNGCKVHKEAEAADWLAKLDMALLQAAVPQPGATITASYPCIVP
jgi:hypothetical protein